MASFRVLTVNVACAGDKSLENNNGRRSAIATLINENNPDIILLQNVNKRRDVEFLDYTTSKLWRHYNYFMNGSQRSVAIMARANIFKMDKVKPSDSNIVGTAEQKKNIQNQLALVRLTHIESKNFLFVGSWCSPVNVGMTDEKKKRLSGLLMSLMRKETMGAFWFIGGDFDVSYNENTIRMAQKNQGEFFNLVEDTGSIACTEDSEENYFVFSGKSAHRRMTFQDVERSQCSVEKQSRLLNCSPVSGTVKITWAAASPRHTSATA